MQVCENSERGRFVLAAVLKLGTLVCQSRHITSAERLTCREKVTAVFPYVFSSIAFRLSSSIDRGEGDTYTFMYMIIEQETSFFLAFTRILSKL